MKRREFLEVTAAAAGATRLAAPFAGVRVPPSDTVRFGMIGVGMQGSGLLGDAIALPGVTCAAAADLYDGRHTSRDRKSTRLNSSHLGISYAVFCLKKKR